MDATQFNEVLNLLHAIQQEQDRQARYMGMLGRNAEARRAIAAERSERARHARMGVAYLSKLQAEGKITLGGARKRARPNPSKKG